MMKEKQVDYEIASRFYSDGIIPVDAIELSNPWRAGLIVLTGIGLLVAGFFVYNRFFRKRR